MIYTQNDFIWCKNCENRSWFVFCLLHKIFAMVTSLEESEKLDLTNKIYANTFHLVKRS